MTHETKTISLLATTTLIVAIVSLFVGTVSLPVSDVLGALAGADVPTTTRFVVIEARLPQVLTAALCGAALSVSGLLLQDIFRNPLADPSVLGISSGAALGVACVMLLAGGSAATVGLAGMGAVVAAAFVGAMAVTAVVFLLSLVVRGNAAMLIVGLMIGYLASALITVLNYFATADGVRSYVMWGMGSFSSVSLEQTVWLAVPIGVAIAAAAFLKKSLDLIQLGDNYAMSLGINTRRVRYGVLLLTGFLTAVATAFCGPVAFIGLAVPHLSRMLLHTDSHAVLLPVAVLTGAMVAMACNVACSLPGGGGVLPVNAVTPMVGAPVIIYIIMRKKK